VPVPLLHAPISAAADTKARKYPARILLVSIAEAYRDAAPRTPFSQPRKQQKANRREAKHRLALRLLTATLSVEIGSFQPPQRSFAAIVQGKSHAPLQQ
jgi:hypothetical protein